MVRKRFSMKNNLKEYNGIRYTIEDGGTISVFSALDKNITEYSIPSEIDGVAVTSISDHAFSDCTLLQSILIPEGIKRIEHMAFSKCYNLGNIVLPSTLEYIGDRAFEYTHITTVTIPEKVEYIGDYAFDNCSQLSNVLIENINCHYNYAFPVYPNANLAKENIKYKNIVNNIFIFQYSESEFTKFALMRNDSNIQIQHVAGSIPHVYDIMRALKIVPEYIQNIPERKYRFTIQANFSERGRGYYKLIYFKKPVSINNEAVTGAYKVACKLEVNSTGKVEDWIDKNIYIGDFIEILYTSLVNFESNKVIDSKVSPMKGYIPISRNTVEKILEWE